MAWVFHYNRMMTEMEMEALIGLIMTTIKDSSDSKAMPSLTDKASRELSS